MTKKPMVPARLRKQRAARGNVSLGTTHRRTPLYRSSDWRRTEEPLAKAEDEKEPYRTAARRDYARLIHAPCFRRLQGKTQLYPGNESDFFRNRLTHSLEVAQIAKSIAARINNTNAHFARRDGEAHENYRIDYDLVELAALAHDLGHPPFGHTGENALDELMREHGGFEGNAQTLRILTKIEKKQIRGFRPDQPIINPIINGVDNRLGLNLTMRSLASVLKYDQKIPLTLSERKEAELPTDGPVKGYYLSEADIVSDIKQALCGYEPEKFKSLECSIMDVADDIAYSTYDLEDSFKANLLSPLQIFALDQSFKEAICKKINKKIEKIYKSSNTLNVSQFNEIVYQLFYEYLEIPQSMYNEFSVALSEGQGGIGAKLGSAALSRSQFVVENGYFRSNLTSKLVGDFIQGVEVEYNSHNPVISSVRLSLETFKRVEILKLISYERLIMSPRLKIVEFRGREIVRSLFTIFKENPKLLPTDWAEIYNGVTDSSAKYRTICDYIACMTDRYCVETYARVTGSDPPSMYKPH